MGDTYTRLRELILDPVQQDTPLTEVTLAGRLGVSRTPIREALKRLEQDGLVERFGRGIRVRQRSPEEILDIYEVRVTLESAAAKAAALRRTELDLSKLDAIHREMTRLQTRGVTAEDVAAIRERILWNDRFHAALWAASHNASLEDVITRLTSHLRHYPLSTLAVPVRWKHVISEHAGLIKSIREGDAERAAVAAADHMTAARDTRLRMYAEVSGAEPLPGQ